MSIWSLRYRKFDPTTEKQRETLCTLGNGYFATRGAAPEAKADYIHYPGTYAAGCYNRLKDKVNGREIENESLVNLPNWLPLTFSLDHGKWFDLRDVEILDYLQELDVRKGILIRRVRFTDADQRITRLDQTRFVNMEYPHLAGLRTTITAENWSGPVEFLSALDGRVENSGVETYRLFNGKHLEPEKQAVFQDNISYLCVRTNQSDIGIAEAARVTVLSPNDYDDDDQEKGKGLHVHRRNIVKRAYVAEEFSVKLEEEKPLTVDKIVSLYTSRDLAISEFGSDALRSVRLAPSFDRLRESHIRYWDDLWRRFRIRVLGDNRAALIVNIHIFHLLQTISPNSIDLDVGIPARGLHGEAYRGHVFWDQLFIFPLLNIHVPDLTRSLIMYRF
jgi:trehalose/maltose hydrolase-like predicted phosphorylase